MSVDSKMTAIADAIRAKAGTTGKLTLDEMAAAIAGLETGGSVKTYSGTYTPTTDVVLSELPPVKIPHGLGVVPQLVIFSYLYSPQLLAVAGINRALKYLDNDNYNCAVFAKGSSSFARGDLSAYPFTESTFSLRSGVNSHKLSAGVTYNFIAIAGVEV